MSLPYAAPEGLLDTEAMFAAAAAFPEQLAAAAVRGGALAPAGQVDHVVCLGMGGSSVAGEVLAAVASPSCPVPISLVNGYELPAFVSAASLVFAVSFSGATEESLSALEQAIERKAHIVCVTGGGALAALAEEAGLPLVLLPRDVAEPRAALGSSLPPLLLTCEAAGLLPGARGAIDAAVAQLDRRRADLARPDGGEAGVLAEQLAGTTPLVFGGGIAAVAARRWKTQVNENAKAVAHFATMPELCHNEICAFAERGPASSALSVVALRHDYEHPRLEVRYRLVEELAGPSASNWLEVRAEGDGPLAQLLDLVYVGDYVSLWLAARAGVDPGPVVLLVELKRRLSGEPSAGAVPS